MRAVWDALRHRRPQIAIAADPTRYRLVVVGCPVWVGRPAAPLRTFLRRYGPRIRSLAAFCVSGSGAAYDEVFDEMADLAGHPPMATLSLAERQVASGEAASALNAFAVALNGKVRPAVRATGLDPAVGWAVEAPISPERHEPHPSP